MDWLTPGDPYYTERIPGSFRAVERFILKDKSRSSGLFFPPHACRHIFKSERIISRRSGGHNGSFSAADGRDSGAIVPRRGK